MTRARATAQAPDTAPLEPEAVAHISWSRPTSTPITVFGDSDEAIAAEMVRASVEQAAAQLASEVTIMGGPDRFTGADGKSEARREKGEKVGAHTKDASKRRESHHRGTA